MKTSVRVRLRSPRPPSNWFTSMSAYPRLVVFLTCSGSFVGNSMRASPNVPRRPGAGFPLSGYGSQKRGCHEAAPFAASAKSESTIGVGATCGLAFFVLPSKCDAGHSSLVGAVIS